MRSQQNFLSMRKWGLFLGQYSKVNSQRQDINLELYHLNLRSHLSRKGFKLQTKLGRQHLSKRASQIRSNSILCLSWIAVDSIAGSFGKIALSIVLVLKMKLAQHFELWATKRPAAVVTSSGAAAANLYQAISNYGS